MTSVFQPTVELDSGRVVADEALARGPEDARRSAAPSATWWNECTLAPVTDATGAVVQYIGIQTDVTASVEAQRALATERDRSRDSEARLAELGRVLQTSTDSPGAKRA